MKKPPLCPCCSGKVYAVSCKRSIDGKLFPENAEQLMRSSYSAFAKSNKAYLLNTWHPSTRPDELNFDKGLTWLNLQIIQPEKGEPGDIEVYVEFEVSYLHFGIQSSMREVSRFVLNKRLVE